MGSFLKFIFSFLVANLLIMDLAIADEIDEIKRRIEALEKHRLPNAMPSAIHWSGVLEIEAGHINQYDNQSESDLVIATALLAVDTELQPALTANLTFLYEEDDTPFDLDEGLLHFHLNDQWSLTAGQFYLPFGEYNTASLSDPLTLELSETRATALMASQESKHWALQLYLYRGDSTTNSPAVENSGINLQFPLPPLPGEAHFSLGVIRNFLDSGNLVDNGLAFDEKAEGMASSVYWETNGRGIAIEYLSALEHLEKLDTPDMHHRKPSASQVEYFWQQEVASKTLLVAASYQQTHDALFLELPKRRGALSISTLLYENLAFTAEIFRDVDYGKSKSMGGVTGTGKDANGLTLQLSTEF